MFKRILSAFLIAVILLSASCGDSGKSGDTPAESEQNQSPDQVEATETEAETGFKDNVPDTNYEGKEFRIRTIENANVHSDVDIEEQTGDTYFDSLYIRNRAIEERFNIKIVGNIAEDNGGEAKIIMAGEDAFDVASVRCTHALTMWEDHLVINIEDIPNIDLTKPYWSQSINESISLANQKYVAIGAFDMNVYDLTFCLLFNKNLAESFSLGNMYSLVDEGKFTTDKMSEQMQVVLADLNGDNKYDENDRWGYLAHTKNVLPNYWIATVEKSSPKDKNDLPYNNMVSDRFNSVFNKAFEITYDTGVYYNKISMDADIPSQARTMFAANQSLFLDATLFYIAALRDMEADFGILPYPKYDEAQDKYYSRVSYYWCCVIPVTNEDTEFTGAILESLNCESANSVVPAYYEIALKGKYSRDTESEQMLQLISDNRIVDIGDTTMCDKIRDNFMASLFASNKRDLASKLASVDKQLQKYIEKIPQKN